MLDKYIKDSKGMFIFTGYLMEIYIPQMYFEKNIATNVGDTINSFGVVYYHILDKSEKVLDDGFFNLPIEISFKVNNMEAREENISGKYGETEKYVILKYYNNESIMPSIINQSSAWTEKFVNLIMKGNFDNNIPYDKLLKMWMTNMDLCNTDIGAPSVILEVMLSEICRHKKNPDTQFKNVIGKDPKVSPLEYVSMNARSIASRNSVFSAMTFEDMDSMITTSLNMKNYNKAQKESPIEKIIKM